MLFHRSPDALFFFCNQSLSTNEPLLIIIHVIKRIYVRTVLMTAARTISDFDVPVISFINLVFSLPLYIALEVNVPDFPVVVLYGMDTVLNCTFTGAKSFNLSELSVFWQLADTQRSVHAYFDKQDRYVDQDERFANRTSLFPSELASGNASLLLRRVRVADEGSYTCFVKVDTYSKDSMFMQVAGDLCFIFYYKYALIKTYVAKNVYRVKSE